MWMLWVLSIAFLLLLWRLATVWRVTRPNIDGGPLHTSGSPLPDQRHNFTTEIEEVPSEVEEEQTDTLSSPPTSTGFNRDNSWCRWNERSCTVMAGIGGLAVGYMTSVAGGLIALPQYLLLISRDIYKRNVESYQDDFCTYRNQWLILYSSAINLMAVIGIFVSTFGIQWGRRYMLKAGAILSVISLSCMLWFPNVAVEVIGILLCGCGVGWIYQVVPTIYSETISVNAKYPVHDWMIILGSIVAISFNYVASRFYIWRITLGVPLLPSLVLLGLSFFIVEPPQYFLEHDRIAKAKDTLKAIRGSDIEVEFAQLVASTNQKPLLNSLREIIRPPNRPALAITTLETLYTKLSGVDLIIFYGPFLLQSAGHEENASFLATIVVAVVQGLAKGIGALLIRWMGRRRIFLAAYLATIVPLVCLGIIFHLNPNPQHYLKPQRATMSIVLLLIYVIGNGILTGPYGWVDSRFPKECTTVASTYELILGSLSTFIANQLFLHMLCALREWTFFIYAIFCLCMMCFTLAFIPETLGIAEHTLVRRVWSRHWFWKRYMR